MVGAYIHMHDITSLELYGHKGYNRYGLILYYHLIVLLGLSSISLSAHQIHVSVPENSLTDGGISYELGSLLTVSVADLLSPRADIAEIVSSGIGTLATPNSYFKLPVGEALLESTAVLLNPSTGSTYMTHIAIHHLATGIALSLSSLPTTAYI